jgi:hypothetical protein
MSRSVAATRPSAVATVLGAPVAGLPGLALRLAAASPRVHIPALLQTATLIVAFGSIAQFHPVCTTPADAACRAPAKHARDG